MEPIRAVLFDLDGTLVDTLGDLADATNEALRRRGFPEHPEEQYRHMVGNGARRLIERALGESCTPDLAAQLLADFVRIYDEGCLRRTAPYPGIPEAVTALKKRGLPLAVVTNKPEKQAIKIVCRFFGIDAFSYVVGGRSGRAAKPDPAAALEVLAALACRPPPPCLSATPMWIWKPPVPPGCAVRAQYGVSAGKRSCVGPAPTFFCENRSK